MGKTFVEDERPCDSCVNVTRYGCVSWNCEYINRDEAIKAWREKNKMADRKTENCSGFPNNSTTEDCSTVPISSILEQVDEPQTCSVNGRPYSECSSCEYFRCTADDPYEYEIKALHKDYIEPYVTIEDEPQTNIPKSILRTDCTGCRFVGSYDTEFPCANCVRKNKDYYDAEQPEGEGNEDR